MFVKAPRFNSLSTDTLRTLNFELRAFSRRRLASRSIRQAMPISDVGPLVTSWGGKILIGALGKQESKLPPVDTLVRHGASPSLDLTRERFELM